MRLERVMLASEASSVGGFTALTIRHPGVQKELGSILEQRPPAPPPKKKKNRQKKGVMLIVHNE